MIADYVLTRVGKEALKKLRDSGSYEFEFDVDHELEDFSQDLLIAVTIKLGRLLITKVAQSTLTKEQLATLTELNKLSIEEKPFLSALSVGAVLVAPAYLLAKGTMGVLELLGFESQPADPDDYYDPRRDPFFMMW